MPSTPHLLGRVAFWSSLMAVTFIALAALAGLSDPVSAWGPPYGHEPDASDRPSSLLAEYALGKVLADASPVLGMYQNVQSNTSTWMKAYPDSTPIAHMNLPGTHDADTWNYSLATQQSLNRVTALVNDIEFDPRAYRCQDLSIVDMLNAGIRVFDLRPAYDVTNTTLVFWHGTALVSQTATMDDLMYGYYQWLDDHPSEALFLSFQYEGGTTPYATEDAGVQQQLLDTLTTPAAKAYILQTTGSFGTLGEARGKITLLKRFDLNLLPASYSDSLPGVHFSPNNWNDNSPNITLIYNKTTGGTAYIEDYYHPLTPEGSSAEENIQVKLDATVAHLSMAAATHPDSLFWTFASSNNVGNVPPDTPEIQALGNGSLTPAGGVNQRLLPVLKTLKGKRLGIVMFDFYETPS